MYDIKLARLITNNPKVVEKYKDIIEIDECLTYYDVLIKARDYVYDKHVLLTHPQASSLKPNQTLYRTIAVYPKHEDENNISDIMLIDKCIQVFDEWQEIAASPKSYDEKVASDFQTIDLSIVDGFMPRIA